MEETQSVPIAPVRGKARIDVLDILRGIAILGIFYINVPYMAAPVWQFSADIRTVGWTAADQSAWGFVTIFLAGTQRCLLEFLFGAGMMVLAKRAMEPEGPVAVADLYYRRNMWLLGFGLADVFVLLWPGDILHIYALAALFLFPFRRLDPKWLVALGLGWAAMTVVGIPEYGAREYLDRTALVQRVNTAELHRHEGATLTPTDRTALAQWRTLSAHKPSAEQQARVAAEIAAHQGGFLPYARESWSYWRILAQDWLVWDVIEAFCTMLIGIALWKWRVIQGGRSRSFYLLLTLAAYGFGLTARALGIAEVMRFDTAPRTIWITGELARLAVGLGHLGLINLLVQTRLGNVALSVFKAPGRMAFSLYFLQQFVGMYILFAPFGFNLWGHFGWAQMAAISTIGVVALTIAANLWMRHFVAGPLEWLWRSLSYVAWQPLRRVNAPLPPDRALQPAP